MKQITLKYYKQLNTITRRLFEEAVGIKRPNDFYFKVDENEERPQNNKNKYKDGYLYKFEGELGSRVEQFKSVIFGDIPLQGVASPMVVADWVKVHVEETKKTYPCLRINAFIISMLTENQLEQFKETFTVYLKSNWEGTTFAPEFLLDYDIKDDTKHDKKPTTKMYGFKSSLLIPLSKKPNYITTFIWDEDPEGSRGTVTTVQSGTGGN